MSLPDVPSPIDLRRMPDARQWSDEAMARRPWRTEFFAAFVEALADGKARRVLELGSGPGFLAKSVLDALPTVDYVALDFSPAMHQLAAERLGDLTRRVIFVERSFRELTWTEGLGLFDHVITNQAVHELRHKRHAPALHEQVRGLLTPGGRYLVSDHFAGDGGMKNDQLYMSIDEQRAALEEAGFTRVEPMMLRGGLMLFGASMN